MIVTNLRSRPLLLQGELSHLSPEPWSSQALCEELEPYHQQVAERSDKIERFCFVLFSVCGMLGIDLVGPGSPSQISLYQ